MTLARRVAWILQPAKVRQLERLLVWAALFWCMGLRPDMVSAAITASLSWLR